MGIGPPIGRATTRYRVSLGAFKEELKEESKGELKEESKQVSLQALLVISD